MILRDHLIRSLEVARERSLQLWNVLSEEHYFWKPDKDAMHALESIRHMLEVDDWFHFLITTELPGNDFTDWDDIPYTNLEDELQRGEPARAKFMELVHNSNDKELLTQKVTYYYRKHSLSMADFVERSIYHEAVHAGSFMSYLRMMGVDRPNIWK